jgi:hypothetical protein
MTDKHKCRYNFYNDHGCGYISKFLKQNPEFNSEQFVDFVISKNRGDRDSGELQDVAKHEVLRLAAEWAEYNYRFNYPEVIKGALI